jgi:hypothetical protein
VNIGLISAVRPLATAAGWAGAAAPEDEDVPALCRGARRRVERRLLAAAPGPLRLRVHRGITQVAGTAAARSWVWIRRPAGIGMGRGERERREEIRVMVTLIPCWNGKMETSIDRKVQGTLYRHIGPKHSLKGPNTTQAKTCNLTIQLFHLSSVSI